MNTCIYILPAPTASASMPEHIHPAHNTRVVTHTYTSARDGLISYMPVSYADGLYVDQTFGDRTMQNVSPNVLAMGNCH